MTSLVGTQAEELLDLAASFVRMGELKDTIEVRHDKYEKVRQVLDGFRGSILWRVLKHGYLQFEF